MHIQNTNCDSGRVKFIQNKFHIQIRGVGLGTHDIFNGLVTLVMHIIILNIFFPEKTPNRSLILCRVTQKPKLAQYPNKLVVNCQITTHTPSIGGECWWWQAHLDDGAKKFLRMSIYLMSNYTKYIPNPSQWQNSDDRFMLIWPNVRIIHEFVWMEYFLLFARTHAHAQHVRGHVRQSTTSILQYHYLCFDGDCAARLLIWHRINHHQNKIYFHQIRWPPFGRCAQQNWNASPLLFFALHNKFNFHSVWLRRCCMMSPAITRKQKWKCQVFCLQISGVWGGKFCFWPICLHMLIRTFKEDLWKIRGWFYAFFLRKLQIIQKTQGSLSILIPFESNSSVKINWLAGWLAGLEANFVRE